MYRRAHLTCNKPHIALSISSINNSWFSYTPAFNIPPDICKKYAIPWHEYYLFIQILTTRIEYICRKKLCVLNIILAHTTLNSSRIYGDICKSGNSYGFSSYTFTLLTDIIQVILSEQYPINLYGSGLMLIPLLDYISEYV